MGPITSRHVKGHDDAAQFYVEWEAGIQASEEPTAGSVVKDSAPGLVAASASELLDLLLDKDAVRQKEVIQLLQSSRPDITLDATGLKPIHVAVICKNGELLQKILGKPDVDVNVKVNGLTPLHLAAQHHFLYGVKRLLENLKTLINELTTREHQSPLMVSLSTEEKDDEGNQTGIILAIIKDKRCLLDQRDNESWTALTYAARTGHVKAGILLLSEGRSQKYTVNQLMNACRMAYLSGHEDFCQVLLINITRTQCIEIQQKISTLKGRLLAKCTERKSKIQLTCS